MGKMFVIGAAIAAGYALGYRDARVHTEHVVTRVVEQVKTTFGGSPGNDVDDLMNRLEGKP